MLLRFLSIVLLLCVLVGSMLTGCAPRTEEPFAAPDSCEGTYGGLEVSFSEKGKIHEAVLSLLSAAQNIQETERDLNMADLDISVLFRYDDVQKCPQKIGEAETPWGERAFDSVHFVLRADEVIVTPYRAAESFGQIKISLDAGAQTAFAAVRRTVSETVGDPFGDVADLSDTEAINAESLITDPAHIILRKGEVRKELAAEEAACIYGSLEGLLTNNGLPVQGQEAVKKLYTPEDLYEDIETETCIKLCYRRNVHFSGAIAQDPASDAPVQGEWTYEALVLILRENGVIVGICKDGLYEGLLESWKVWDFGPGYSDFRAEVLALMS